ncbi:glycine/D-amino acid oxidase-like deaminating enzyme [Gelidibacter algens]|uniref:Glycine/D-amino acid oxidase-like deaminating enzyme n=1 Tax=Gelidibacter algens TaxID=49280 RepID=A0A1A7QU14_9FLAO|nr:FAD-binding oxidoreductase [Gelidibacter algens]OBX23006.1 FAD-dependent oxidoreductase [Gelidibacter algens]RAJ19901.1 glycine/D-amino acid oxidase-like deaminating enzyme [Gelidibacter algens]
MKEVDYIIVGCGLAGVSFCEELRAHEKSFVMFDDQSQQASIVAAGLYNPVILKRFTAVWKAKEQLEMVNSFYERLEKLLGVKLDYKLPVYRRFSSIGEQNDWFNASDNPYLENYLSPQVIPNHNSEIDASFGFGKVLESGRIDTSTLLTHYKLFLKTNNSYCTETFDHAAVKHHENEVIYKNITAKYIVFAEGFGMMKNPFFKDLPLNEAKGEVLTIKAPQLKMEFILKASVFLVPELDDCYSVGATYNWEDKTNDITETAKTELLDKLKTLISCDYEVVNQAAGIRPTVMDRKPLVGRHPKYDNMAILNGLGTRGVMIGPYVAKQLFLNLEKGIPLEAEIDIKRFQK